MNDNRKAKERLIELYGPECFIDKLHLRPGGSGKYTGKAQMQKMRELTYHHIRPKSKGGRADVENRSFVIGRQSCLVSQTK